MLRKKVKAKDGQCHEISNPYFLIILFQLNIFCTCFFQFASYFIEIHIKIEIEIENSG